MSIKICEFKSPRGRPACVFSKPAKANLFRPGAVGMFCEQSVVLRIFPQTPTQQRESSILNNVPLLCHSLESHSDLEDKGKCEPSGGPTVHPPPGAVQLVRSFFLHLLRVLKPFSSQHARFYARAVQLANWGALTGIILSGVLLSKF